MTETTTPLGRRVPYPAAIDPSVLFAIARSEARKSLGIDASGELPFVGADIWNAWELSWLDAQGKPCIAVAELRVPHDSANLVESKSLKLYLAGYAMTRFEDAHDVAERTRRDVSACAGAEVEVSLLQVDAFDRLRVDDFAGESLDGQLIAATDYATPQPNQLRNRPRARPIEEALVTQLFRSRCPVTGQPDLASLRIRYRGRPIDHASLLRYLVSFREYGTFQEACVERIFVDVQARCRPLALMVYARFLRRGGIDINPWRATPGFAGMPANLRSSRQ